MKILDLLGKPGERKYNMGLFCVTLIFILALFDRLDEIAKAGIIAIYVIAVGGNVGSKVTKALEVVLGKKGSLNEQGK